MTTADLHLKGFMLRRLHEQGAMWDYELAEQAMQAYGFDGDYWYGTVRLTLTDLFSAGLIEELATAVDAEKSFGQEKILFRFGLTDFGLARMRQSGLLEEVAT